MRCGRNAAIAVAMLGVVPWAAVSAEPPPKPAAVPPPLTSIADILALPAHEVSKRPPVAIEGVITWCNLASNCMILESDTDPIFVSLWPPPADDSPFPKAELEPGRVVAVEGEAFPGGYSPTIIASRIRVTGRRAIPPEEPADLGRLFRGADTGRRATVEGVVQGTSRLSGDRIALALDTSIGPMPLEIFGPSIEPQPERLVDAAIRVSVMVGAVYNSRGQFVGPVGLVSDNSSLQVLAPPPADPFAGEITALETLARFQPRPRSSHRVRTEGIITYAAPGLLYIAEGDAGVRVELIDAGSETPEEDAERFTAGDRVRVAGFVDMSRRIAKLTGAVVRRIANGSAPQPHPVEVSEIFRLAESFRQLAWITEPGSHDGQLVRCRGVVEAVETKPDRLVVALAADKDRWSAEVRPPTTATAALLPVGTEVDIAGILVTDIDAQQLNGLLVSSPATQRMTVLARDASDITVVRPVSWWTRGRLLGVLTGVSAALVLTVGLAAALGREVRRQATDLATTLQSQREATIEFETALRERNRLAANLHDTVLQTVTGLGFQLQVCQVEAERRGDRGPSRLEVARRMVNHAVEQLRGAVWALHSPIAPGNSLWESLEQITSRLQEGHDTPIRYRFAGDERPLPENVAANLLLVAREAVANALVHAQASGIEVVVTFTEPTVTLVVRDDGRGFDAGDHPGPLQGHFGLEGMVDRMQAVGGTCTVESRPGVGTTVTAVAPTLESEADLSDRAGTAAAGRGSMS